jgi:hypothetical protein
LGSIWKYDVPLPCINILLPFFESFAHNKPPRMRGMRLSHAEPVTKTVLSIVGEISPLRSKPQHLVRSRLEAGTLSEGPF